ncbi:MAG: hypothetical protein IPL84_14325 [Chitinophagaceae bacterium]|nr:hypothetical protein [Chitinophagaceae bacterium]
MKKIFTLLLTTAMLSTAFAQYGHKGQGDRGDDKINDVYVSNNKDFGHDGFDRRGAYIFTAREKNRQIAQINRDYDYKIQSVRNRAFMSWFQKKRLINNLDEQRYQEIDQIVYRFNSPLNRFGDRNRNYQKKNW